MTSADGVTWTARSAAEASAWLSVTYGSGLFVAVASSGTNRVMTSADGVTWTARTAAEANYWSSVTYGSGVFVAVGADGTNRVMTSPDGVTWTARSAAEANSWLSVTYGSGLFVAVANGGLSRAMTSADGVTWTKRLGGLSVWSSVTYGGGLFVAVASSGTNRVMTSVDGVTWPARSAAEANSFRSVTYGSGLFVAVASTGTNRVMTSGTFQTTPAASTALVATPGNGSVSVAFTEGADGGAAISNHEYQLDDGAWVAFSPAVTSSPVTIPGLTNGTSYSLRLRAVNSVGAGAASDPVSVTPRTVPAAPTGLVAVAGDGSASVSFTPAATGGAAITRYQYRVGTGAWVDAGSTSPVTVTGLTNYVTTPVRVRAVNVAGPGAASVSISLRPRATAPSLLAAVTGVRSTVRVEYGGVSIAGASINGYTATAYASGTSTPIATCHTNRNFRSCTIAGLVAGTDYDVRVVAYFTASRNGPIRQTIESETRTVRTASAP